MYDCLINFADYYILFVFTFYTTPQLFWKQCCMFYHVSQWNLVAIVGRSVFDTIPLVIHSIQINDEKSRMILSRLAWLWVASLTQMQMTLAKATALPPTVMTLGLSTRWSVCRIPEEYSGAGGCCGQHSEYKTGQLLFHKKSSHLCTAVHGDTHAEILMLVLAVQCGGVWHAQINQ